MFRTKRKDKRVHNKLKKQIAELLLVGKQPNDVEEALNESMSSADGEGSSTKKEKDIGHMVSRKLAVSRRERQPGPELFLTLPRLGGMFISHQEVAELVHYSLIGPAAKKPRWCNFRPWKSTSQTIVLRINCPKRFIETEGETLPEMDKFFERQWIKMDTAIRDRETFWKSILHVPVSLQAQIRERLKTLDSAPRKDSALKLDMILSHAEMADSGFPFPDDCELIIPTKDKYAEVTGDSPLFALDCEMCITDAGMHELTRISILNEDGSVLIDTLVKPKNRITDYLTKYSGITEELLKDVTVKLEDVQSALRAVLPPDAIIVGHSLEFDLRAMRMAHPYCLDISHLFNISGGSTRKTGLKTLSSMFLDEDIQSDDSGHCSVVDAFATLRLLKMKMENGLMFGNVLYGWEYDKWVAEYEQNLMSLPVEADAHGKKKKMKISGRENEGINLCECGQLCGVGCIVDGCQCQVSPPTECVLCMGKRPLKKEDEARMTIDWRESIRPKEVISSRPLSFYLIDSRKTVLSAYNAIQSDIKSKLITRRDPLSCDSPSQFFSSCCMELLEYGLALIEYSHEGEVGHEKEEAQNQMKVIDDIVHQVLTAAAKFALIVVVLSSEETSICYLKVKR